MTREEEDRRLALSAAIAQINAAIDAVRKIDDSTPNNVRGLIACARTDLRAAASLLGDDLDALKQKAIDEEREATK